MPLFTPYRLTAGGVRPRPGGRRAGSAPPLRWDGEDRHHRRGCARRHLRRPARAGRARRRGDGAGRRTRGDPRGRHPPDRRLRRGARARRRRARRSPYAPDLVLVCTKAQDAEAAIAANAALIDGVPVVVVQNGLDGVATAARLLPRSSCMGVLSIIAANYTEPGVVRVTTHRRELPRARRRPGRRPSAVGSPRVLSDAVPVVAIDGFRGAQWTKLIVEHAERRARDRGPRACRTSSTTAGLRRVVAASMRETVRVGIARGIRFGSLQGLGDRRLRLFARMPLADRPAAALARCACAWATCRTSARPSRACVAGSRPRSTSSTGSSCARQPPPASTRPVNAALTTLVHEVEASRRVPARRRASLDAVGL